MKGISYPEVTLKAEDREFVVSRPYLLRHECGAVIIGRGTDIHDAIVMHTALCTYQKKAS